MVGFASGIEAEEIPMVSGRALCFGNFDIVGVILAYVDAACASVRHQLYPGPGTPLQSSDDRDRPPGAGALLELFAAGAIRPIVGRTVPFDGLALALDDMESRTTTGAPW